MFLFKCALSGTSEGTSVKNLQCHAISIANGMTEEEVAAHFSGLRSFNVSLKYGYHVSW